MVGFCNALVKPPGPVHAYVAPATAGVERFIVAPAHTAGLVAVGVAGIGLTVVDIIELAAGFPVAHGVMFEVKETLTVCPFVSEVVVKVLLEVGAPTFIPLTLH